jgi:hypothetical protein
MTTSLPGRFVIEGQYLGEALIPPRSEHEYPFSRAYFCQRCGRIWATVSTGKDYSVYSKQCVRCPRTFTHEILGSVILSFDTEVSQNLPFGVLQWELDRHLDWHEWLKSRKDLELK